MNIPAYLSKYFYLDEVSNIQKLREKFFRIFLIISSVIGALLYVLEIIPAVKEGRIFSVFISSVVYLGLLSLVLKTNISYRNRVISWLLILYIFGLHNYSFSEFYFGTGVFILVYVIFVMLFLDLHTAIIILALSMAGIVYLQFFIIQENYAFNFRPSQKDHVYRTISYSLLLFGGICVVIYTVIFISQLIRILKNAENIFYLLEDKNKEIMKNEAHFRSLVETSPDTIMRFDLEGNIETINQAGEKLFGLLRKEIRTKNLDDFLIPQEKNDWNTFLERILEEGDLRDVDVNIYSRQGLPVPVQFSGAPVSDINGEVVGVIGILKDISIRKKFEENLQAQTEELKLSQQQLRALTHKTISAQEDERRIISRELHDNAGHALILLKYGLGTILEELNSENGKIPMEQRLEKCLEYTDQAMNNIRSASHRLRPPDLEVGGLNIGLEGLCYQYSMQASLQVGYQGIDIVELPDDLAICLYRFVQEALTNTLKHANADQAEVYLNLEDDEIILSVVDNGNGSTDAEMQPSGIGLLGLRERFGLFSGRIDVGLSPSGGYSITAMVPWKI